MEEFPSVVPSPDSRTASLGLLQDIDARTLAGLKHANYVYSNPPIA
jgi:hypothetical protein